jgi:hypothetical protein
MKKLVVTLALVAFTLSAVVAAPFFQIGPTAQYEYTLKDIEASADGLTSDDVFDINNYSFGVDARINVLFLQVAANGLYGQTEEGNHRISTVLTGNLLFNPLDILTISAGFGPSMQYVTSDFKEFTVNGESVSNFGEVFMNSPLVYRAQVGLDLGGIGISGTYLLPTTGSFKNFEASNLTPDWQSGKFSLSVLFNLF